MARTDTIETTDQHIGSETDHDQVEPVILTIEATGATLIWTLSEHASAHYAELSPDEQASYQQAAGRALERTLDEGSAILCAAANPNISDLLMSLGALLGNPDIGVDVQVIRLGGEDPFGDVPTPKDIFGR